MIFNSVKDSKDANAWFRQAKKDKNDSSIELASSVMERGKMYKFKYKSDSKFYDKEPLIISLGQVKFKNKYFDMGINLNLFPYYVKVKIITSIQDMFKSLLDQQQTGRNSNQANKQKLLGLKWEQIKYLNNIIHLNLGVRNYSSEKKEVYCVSYENWDRLVRLEVYNFQNGDITSVLKQYKLNAK